MDDDSPYILTSTQEYALQRIFENFNKNINSVCSIRPGMGKTAIACKIIKYFFEQEKNKIIIIVKAANLKDPWMIELSKFRINYNLIYGNERIEKRINNKYDISGQKVLLISHNTLVLDVNYILEMEKFDLLIIDEIHTIINPKKLTIKSIEISSIKASKKLFISATPIQNSHHDLGLIHIMLNKPELFNYITENDIDNEHIMERAYKEAIEKNIVVQMIDNNYEKKSILRKQKLIKKSSIILSIPIYNEMVKYIINNKDYILGNNLIKYTYSKRLEQFLSHPKSIYKNNTTFNKFINCTKIDTVEFIIRNKLKNEKIIIFSRFKDVLYHYSESLKEIGHESITITGEDKTESDRKLKLFKESDVFNILLTTLFKSAEGINLPEANHVVILELWWNPQRLFQAIGRIDRHNQKKDIFIYLLCYNINGILSKHDSAFLEKMEDKKNKAKEVIESQDDFPSMHMFTDETTFKDELKLFLVNFTDPKKKKLFKNDFKNIIEHDQVIMMDKIKKEQEELERVEAQEKIHKLFRDLYFINPPDKYIDDIDLS